MSKPKRVRPSMRRREALQADWTPEGLGVDAERYQTVLRYLFDRPVPEGQQQEWYWADDHVQFDATPLEWTRFQTAIFANAGIHLLDFSDEQVGMGLNYLINNSVSDVPFAAVDASVPLDEAMRMMEALPRLWRDCIGPRLSGLQAPIGSGKGGRLGHACYMWFDVWSTFYPVRDMPQWRDSLWQVFVEMLKVPCREVQIAALHGIGHRGSDLRRDEQLSETVGAFVAGLRGNDEELRHYAEAALLGRVQ